MRPTRIVLRFCAVLSFLLLLRPAFGKELQFSVSYPATAFAGPFSGRALICLSKTEQEPRFGPDWFHPSPMASQMFTNIKPGDPMRIDDDAIGFPGKLSTLPAGKYYVQAVLDRNLGGRSIGSSPGNLYSSSKQLTLNPGQNQTISLVCDQVVEPPAFQETDRVKEVRFQSKLLSDFYGRPTFMTAAVVLPKTWMQDPNRKFPILYEVPGFGGTHYDLSGQNSAGRWEPLGESFLVVMLDPDCPLGHCVFADSANNGPWGRALTTELIPEIERRYRAIGTPETRFVTGHSSGGWSSLWLQITYPNVFGGCWSTSPDPVDFRDFQRIDLYGLQMNMFTDELGNPRPLARFGDQPVLFYKSFSDMERPLRGEQLGSFEAVFSPRGADGAPLQLWNRDTGAIDPKVAESWKKYDIDLILRTHWKELGPQLSGKIHVYMGDRDTFYLEGAVKRLQTDLKQLGSDAVVEIVPGDHGSMMTPALSKRILDEITAQFRQAKEGP